MKLRTWLIEKFFFQLGDLILGTKILRTLKVIREYTSYSEESLLKLQEKKLFTLLLHACSTCQAYKGYNSSQNDPFIWIKQFPVLKKQDLNNNLNEYISIKYKKKKLIKYESSGSTGFRSEVYVDKIEQSVFRAILINWWEWNGYQLGDPIVQTGMTTKRGFIKQIKDIVLRTTYIDAFRLEDSELLLILKKLEKKKNKFLTGYASSLYVMAKVANLNNLNIRFEIVLSFGDKLFDHYKLEIEKAFNAKVVEDYGCNEGLMIGQKKDLPFFYIYNPSIYLELLDNNDYPVEDGEIGRVIATKLDGYAMPLIRYDTGDLAIKLPQHKYPLKCDYSFPLLEKVIGRNTDIITTTSGKNLIVHTFTGIFEYFPEILQFQIIQNEKDKIIINYIPSQFFNQKVFNQIEEKIEENTKANLKIEWKQVKVIEPSASGKPQIIINNLIKNSLSDLIV